MSLFDLILRPSSRTMEKIGVVKRLLKEGLPLHKAIKVAGLGWKNYYKYAPLVYDDPDILVPLPKHFSGTTGTGWIWIA